MNKFPENLKRMMEVRGVKQIDVAEALGVTKQSVSRWIHGGSITVDNLYQLARLLNCSPSDLVGGDVDVIEVELLAVFHRLTKAKRRKLLIIARELEEE